MSGNPLHHELDLVINQSQEVWEELRGKNLFITGGTGFFGCWLLESLIHANQKLNLGIRCTLLTRDESYFRTRWPHLANHSFIQFHRGEIRDFSFPEGEFSHVIHAASPAAKFPNPTDPIEILDSITLGTRRVLDFVRDRKVKTLLLTSSGGIYGKVDSQIGHVSEDYKGSPDPTDPRMAYHEGKRIAELLACSYAAKYGFEVKIARCFAFVGPYLPLNAHYAIGNFLKNILKNQSIQISGDGTPLRSYMYAADLALWLWKILVHGKSCHPYNVGSDQEISIKDLAEKMTSILKPSISIDMGKTPVLGKAPEWYVPSLHRAKTELNLQSHFSLEEAIKRTAEWNLANPENLN